MPPCTGPVDRLERGWSETDVRGVSSHPSSPQSLETARENNRRRSVLARMPSCSLEYHKTLFKRTFYDNTM